MKENRNLRMGTISYRELQVWKMIMEYRDIRCAALNDTIKTKGSSPKFATDI